MGDDGIAESGVLNEGMKRWQPTLIALVFGCSLPAASEATIAEGCGPDYSILCEAIDLITANYVDVVEETALIEAATEGVRTLPASGSSTISCGITRAGFEEFCSAAESVAADPRLVVESALFAISLRMLDPNSVYLDPEAEALVDADRRGQVEGIGAVVTSRNFEGEEPCVLLSESCRVVIVSTFEGGPAEQAGLESEDVVVEVDGVAVAGKTLDQVTSEVRGPEGTEVEIRILTPEQTELVLRIERRAIEIPVIESMLVGEVGYVRLYQFTETAAGRLDGVLGDLIGQGARKLIFDLRQNPGGVLNGAVEIAGEFVAEGLILSTHGRVETIDYPADGNARAVGLPLVVLVDAASASASEVVAGALQDAGVAIVVGETTYGKNTVQQSFDLSDGGALRLTIARWVTRSGRNLDDGVTPDFVARLSEEPEVIVEQVIGLVGDF